MQGLFLSLNKKNQWDDFKHTTTFGQCVLTFPGEQKVLLDDFPSECEQKIASTTTQLAGVCVCASGDVGGIEESISEPQVYIYASSGDNQNTSFRKQ